MSKKKKFDCVGMKHAIQEKIYEETRHMTWEQEREHFRKSIEAGPLSDMWKAIQARQEKGKKAS